MAGSIGSTSTTGLGLTGLSSGLDTSGIITKLMAIESQPQTQLKTQLKTQQGHTTALQSLNTAVAAVATSARSALAANALTSFTATSSSTAVTATASSSAITAVTQFTVDRLAQSQVSVTAPMADTAALASSDHTITLQVGSAAGLKITAASSSIDDMVAAINGAGAGVSAAKIAAGTVGGVPQFRLQLSATTSGAAAGFQVFRGDSTAPADRIGAASTPALTTVTAAQDAQITLYPGSDAAQAVTSSTNRFAAVSPGLDVTVGAVSSTPVSVSVTADASAATTSAQAFTAGLIQLFSGIAASTAITTSPNANGSSSSSATSGSVFTGDSLVRNLKDALLNAATEPVGGRSISSIGINLTKDGTITFDQAKFQAAMASDPAGTVAMYQAVATKVAKVAGDASAPTSGTISQAITSETSQQSSMTTQIGAWDTRLASIQAQYQAQFTAMEVALNNLSAQSTYIAGQISGMTTNYQSSK